MIKVINQSEGDIALNIGRIVQYKCNCGSFGTISAYFDLDDKGNVLESIECPDCGESLKN